MKASSLVKEAANLPLIRSRIADIEKEKGQLNIALDTHIKTNQGKPGYEDERKKLVSKRDHTETLYTEGKARLKEAEQENKKSGRMGMAHVPKKPKPGKSKKSDTPFSMSVKKIEEPKPNGGNLGVGNKKSGNNNKKTVPYSPLAMSKKMEVVKPLAPKQQTPKKPPRSFPVEKKTSFENFKDKATSFGKRMKSEGTSMFTGNVESHGYGKYAPPRKQHTVTLKRLIGGGATIAATTALVNGLDDD